MKQVKKQYKIKEKDLISLIKLCKELKVEEIIKKDIKKDD
jgi:hypothetical protein